MSEIYASICTCIIYISKIFVFVRMLEEIKVIPKNWKITNKVVHTPTTPTETFFCGDDICLTFLKYLLISIFILF